MRGQSFGSVGPYEILPNNSTSSKAARRSTCVLEMNVYVHATRKVHARSAVPQERSWELIFYTRLREGARSAWCGCRDDDSLCAQSLIRDHLILPAREEALFSNDTAVWVMRQVRCRICVYGHSTHLRKAYREVLIVDL